jgi:hypothetical protein
MKLFEKSKPKPQVPRLIIDQQAIFETEVPTSPSIILQTNSDMRLEDDLENESAR